MSYQLLGVLEVSNLPLNKHFEAIKSRLTKLTDSCGGKPQFIQNGKTLIRFASKDDAQRCLNRINGADVYGNKINVRLFGEQHYTSDHTNSRYGSQHYLPKSGNKNRDQSMSRSNFAQNPKPTDININSKSVLKGLFTKKDDDFKRVVMDLVNTWNDPQISSESIIDVQRSIKYGKGEGKHTLFIEAVDAKACRALLNGAKKYLISTDGLEWKPFVSHSDFLSQKTDTKSFIEGIDSKSGQNVTKLVKQLVQDWNDSEVRPNFIENVERDRKFSSQNGVVALYVTATNPKASKALVVGAKRHLTSESGIKWHHILPKKFQKSNSGTVGPPAHHSNQSIKPKRLNGRNITSLMSVIKGVETKCDENVTQTVRQIIHNWNDSQIKANFVKLVERDRKYSDKSGDVLLFVTATTPEANQALISTAAKYWQSNIDRSWTQYQSKSRSKSKDSDLESNVSDMLSQFSSTQDISICSSLQNLNQIVVSDDCKSVILGLTSNDEQNLIEIVRNIVFNWNDRAVVPNYIRNVERLPGFSNIEGKVPLLVTAISPQSCLALVSAAEKYLIAGDGIVWSHFKSDQQIKYEGIPQQTEIHKQINNENDSDLYSINTAMNSLELEAPKPLPRKNKPIPQLSENDSNEENSKPKEKNFLKSVVNNLESFFKTTKSSQLIPDHSLVSNPRVPFNHFIGDRMKSGFMISISGRPNISVNSFTIDFFANTDIAFHFGVQFRNLYVVRNSRVKGEWGWEDKSDPIDPICLFPFTEAFDIIVRIESNRYVVKVNGRPFCYFDHRIPLEFVKGLSITGDLTINWIRFSNN